MKKCFVHLGKHGDLMVIMPGWLKLYKSTGEKPVVMVSKEFAPTLEGVTYVNPWITNLHWYGDCGKARLMAEQVYGRMNVIFPKWWDDPTFTPPEIRHDATSLIIHGKRMKIEAGEWFSYMASQWKYAGFPPGDIHTSVVFDNRDLNVERALADQLYRSHPGKKILYCLNTGGSSPFPFVSEVQRVLGAGAIDLMMVRAPRIFDLLTAIEQAALVVTTDTAILHLMSATKTPYFAFIANGGGGSIPRGNCIAAVRYSDTITNLGLLNLAIESL